MPHLYVYPLFFVLLQGLNRDLQSCDNTRLQGSSELMSKPMSSIGALALGAILSYSGEVGFGQSTDLQLDTGTMHGLRVSGGSSPRALEDPSASGTVVVALALSEGLVLAADSRLTLTYEKVTPSYKIASDATNKLFSVGNFAIAMFGEAFLNGRSVASYIDDFRFKLAKDASRDVDKFAKEFADFIGPVYDQNGTSANSKPILGFIVEGYDSTGSGKILEIGFPVARTPTLRYNTKTQRGGLWRGHTDVISRLLKGWDPRIRSLPAVLGLPDDTRTALSTQLDGIEYFIPWDYLMLQDGIDLAQSLVKTTVDVQRFAFGTVSTPGDIPSVGGRVDSLVVTPSELVWVNRKTLTSQ